MKMPLFMWYSHARFVSSWWIFVRFEDGRPREDDTALGAHPHRVGGEAVLGNDPVAAGHQVLVELVQLRVAVVRQDLAQRRLGRGHHERVAVEGALLADLPGGDERPELIGHADRAAREAAADRLREAHDV